MVLVGVYVNDVLGAYIIKEDERFKRTVRVLKCEKCPGIAGRSTDREAALCVACAPLAVPKNLLQHAKGHQEDRAAKMLEDGKKVPEDFHDLIKPQALYDKWNANQACVHCGRQTVLIADVELYGACSMDRKDGKFNYMDPCISCRPCNNMMKDYDKAVVKYAIATGAMPLHEQRDDYLEYQATRVNHQFWCVNDLKCTFGKYTCDGVHKCLECTSL